jgi:hypothetical protein
MEVLKIKELIDQLIDYQLSTKHPAPWGFTSTTYKWRSYNYFCGVNLNLTEGYSTSKNLSGLEPVVIIYVPRRDEFEAPFPVKNDLSRWQLYFKPNDYYICHFIWHLRNLHVSHRLNSLGHLLMDDWLHLIDGRWHSSVLYVQSFKGAYCDTDHYNIWWLQNLGRDWQ